MTDATRRPIVRWPPDELRLAEGAPLKKSAVVSQAGIRDLLRGGLLRLAVVDIGKPIRHLTGVDMYRHWTSELAPHLADPDLPQLLDDYDGEYLYFAEWWTPSDGEGDGLLVFVKHH